MSEEEKKESTFPNLSFGDETVNAAGTEQKAEETVADENMKIVIDDSILTEEEKQAVLEFSEKIDLTNTQAIMEYGASAQKEMADFSQKTLENVRAKDLGEIGQLLAAVTGEVKNFDNSTEKKGFLGLFKKAQVKAGTLKAKYDKAETSIAAICNNLEDHQITLKKDIVVMDEMYQKNLDTYKTITMYILAGKKKLDAVRTGELADLKAKAEASGLPEDAQKAKDLADQCDRFEKKIYDLETTRTICQQSGPQIRMIQSSDTQMAEKIQSVIVNTIPLWKNQMVITLAIAHSNEAIEAENAVTNATNELLKKNAEQLHIASTAAAKANQRGIVDIETLRACNAKLLTTLSDVMQINEEGKEKRRQAELELQNMEGELKKKLLELSKS